MSQHSNAKELELSDVASGCAGAKARTRNLAKFGIQDLTESQEIRRDRRDITQYRACISLMWSRDQILQETGWSLQRLMSVERTSRDEYRRMWDSADSTLLFAEYREQQMLCCKELQDMAEIFRGSKQFAALTTAIKARSSILEQIIKVGQELGVIKRAARELQIHGHVDIRSMSISELQVHLSKEVTGLQAYLADPQKRLQGTVGAVLRRITQPVEEGGKVIDASLQLPTYKQEPIPAEPRAPRVKQLAPT
jgi:hypothetical protein